MWHEKQYADKFDVNWSNVRDTVQRIHVNDVDPEEFIERFEALFKPVVIVGAQDGWGATQKWTLEVFDKMAPVAVSIHCIHVVSLQRLTKKYRNQKFKCGEDNEGYSVKLKMKYYADYTRSTNDDSPLYIFDSSYGDVRNGHSINLATQCQKKSKLMIAASQAQEVDGGLRQSRVLPRRPLQALQ